MFTLKLYRRGSSGDLETKIVAVHRVVSKEFGVEGSPRKCLELAAFGSDLNNDFQTYFLGDLPEPQSKEAAERSVVDRQGVEHFSLWGWGLLENWEGNTTQHFRPGSYG